MKSMHACYIARNAANKIGGQHIAQLYNYDRFWREMRDFVFVT